MKIGCPPQTFQFRSKLPKSHNNDGKMAAARDEVDPGERSTTWRWSF
jgi:hypothetical protein